MPEASRSGSPSETTIGSLLAAPDLRPGDEAGTTPSNLAAPPPLPSGVVAFVKRDCPTCVLVAPVLAELAKRVPLAVYSQDDPAFPEPLVPIDDRDLSVS